jgi:uncharacterized protein (UPF0332 family)
MMAHHKTHLQLAAALLADMRSSTAAQEWPITVDAGYYAVFHAMEALNATECRNSHSFADAGEILDSVLARRFLGEAFVDQYYFLFYFRRGTLYGAHTPNGEQLARYREVAEQSYASVISCVADMARRYRIE